MRKRPCSTTGVSAAARRSGQAGPSSSGASGLPINVARRAGGSGAGSGHAGRTGKGGSNHSRPCARQSERPARSRPSAVSSMVRTDGSSRSPAGPPTGVTHRGAPSKPSPVASAAKTSPWRATKRPGPPTATSSGPPKGSVPVTPPSGVRTSTPSVPCSSSRLTLAARSFGAALQLGGRGGGSPSRSAQAVGARWARRMRPASSTSRAMGTRSADGVKIRSGSIVEGLPGSPAAPRSAGKRSTA